MKCNYRRCENEFIESGRKKYCSRNCKDMEKIYLKRSLVPLKKRGRKKMEYKLLVNLTEKDKQKLIELRQK
jgi:hypothetical protein